VKRFSLVLRLVIEVFIGMLCLSDLTLLPEIWRNKDHIGVALGELLGALFFILIGILCFKDVVKISRILKGSLPTTSLR